MSILRSLDVARPSSIVQYCTNNTINTCLPSDVVTLIFFPVGGGDCVAAGEDVAGGDAGDGEAGDLVTSESFL